MTVRDIRMAVQNLPKGIRQLNDAYNGTNARIERQDPARVELAKTMFCWITHARRPLSAVELQEALAVKDNDEELDEENKVIIDEVVTLCEGLVTVDGKSGIVCLIHYTTDQFLRNIKGDWIAKCPVLLASTCLTYLAFSTFSSGPCSTNESLRARVTCNKLFRYVVHHWNHHTLGVQAEMIKLAVRLLQDNALVRSMCQGKLLWNAAYQGDERVYQFYPPHLFDNTYGIDLAAMYGLEVVCDCLLETGTGAGQRDSCGKAPYGLSARLERDLVARLLLARDDVDAVVTENRGRTPLLRAAEKGHATAVKILLAQNSLNMAQADTSGRTPLSVAIAQGNERIVKLLLDWEMAQTKYGVKCHGKLLFEAVELRHVRIVELLLACDKIDANLANIDGMTPLHAAVRNSDEVITKLLLSRKDINANSADKKGKTPLSVAVAQGHEQAVKLLLDWEKAQQIMTSNSTGSRCLKPWS